MRALCFVFLLGSMAACGDAPCGQDDDNNEILGCEDQNQLYCPRDHWSGERDGCVRSCACNDDSQIECTSACADGSVIEPAAEG